MGLFDFLGFGNKPQVTTNQYQVDPSTQAYVQGNRQNAQNEAAGLNIDPAIMAMIQQYISAGGVGASAVGGNEKALGSFVNPYMNAMEPFFAKLRSQAGQGADSLATGAGAFGGNRAQIAKESALSNVDTQQGQFQYQNYQDAFQRALQAAQLGTTGASLGAGLPIAYSQARQGLLNSSIGPYGYTNTETAPPAQGNGLAGLLGLISTGYGLYKDIKGSGNDPKPGQYVGNPGWLGGNTASAGSPAFGPSYYGGR